MKQLWLIVLILVVSGCSVFDDLGFGTTNIPVRTDEFEGVIFTAENASQAGLAFLLSDDIAEYWTPTEDQIMALEADLVPFLQDELDPEHYAYGLWDELPEYERQYVGILSDQDQQLIYANYFCDGDSFEDWQNRFVFVMDGGECFFQVTYDPEQRTFSSLMINGFA